MTLNYPLALLEAIVAIIFYSVLYAVLDELPDKLTDKINSQIGTNPKTINSPYFALESITLTDGLIVGLDVTSLPSSSDLS